MAGGDRIGESACGALRRAVLFPGDANPAQAIAGPGIGRRNGVRGAPHPNAGRLFMNFLLSDEAQKVYAENGSISILGVKPDKLPARSIVIHRYYDEADPAFGAGKAPSIPEAAAALGRRIAQLRDSVCGNDAASCEAYVGSNVSGSDVGSAEITAACTDYVNQRGM